MLISMSRSMSCRSQSFNKFSNSVTQGADNKISSAYKIMYRLQLGLERAATSSKYIANRKGDKTDPCLTPDSIWNTVDQEFPHLIQVKHPRNRFSIISRIGTCIYLFINLIRRALWLTLSNALERSIALRLTLLPLETHWSTILRTVYN